MAKLNTDYYKNNELFPLTEEEKVISYYIYKKSPNEDYNDLIKDDNRYFVKYNFSDYRSSILRWYPFRKDASVLEINAEYGAMTGALCDNCKKVIATDSSIFKAKLICERYKNRKNLSVYAADIADICFAQKFDYIISFKGIENVFNPVEYLNSLKNLLKENGVLIFECENKYGIQYLTGKKESHSGIPFDSIAGYPNGQYGHGYTKIQVDKYLDMSEFKTWRFFYPLPDSISPRAIYSDEGCPAINMIERLFVFHEDSSSLIADDRQMYIDAVENGVYSFVSNHFIVEASNKKQNLSDIKSTTLSGYRPRKKSCATIIHSNGTVEKKGLFPETKKYLSHLCELSNRIEKQNINILSMKNKNNSLFMTFVTADTLQIYLVKLLQSKRNRNKVFKVFDELWSAIINSSECSNTCAIKDTSLDLRPVLKNAYLEMVSINSFWIDNKIVFFDQEIERKNYPAKYVLWRSINMLYGQVDKDNPVISKSELLNRFDISVEMEKLFYALELQLDQEENPYQIFYKNNLSFEQLKNNRLKLL